MLAPEPCLRPWVRAPWHMSRGCTAFSYLLPSLHTFLPQEFSLLLWVTQQQWAGIRILGVGSEIYIK